MMQSLFFSDVLSLSDRKVRNIDVSRLHAKACLLKVDKASIKFCFQSKFLEHNVS